MSRLIWQQLQRLVEEDPTLRVFREQFEVRAAAPLFPDETPFAATRKSLTRSSAEGRIYGQSSVIPSRRSERRNWPLSKTEGFFLNEKDNVSNTLRSRKSMKVRSGPAKGTIKNPKIEAELRRARREWERREHELRERDEKLRASDSPREIFKRVYREG